VPKLISRYPDGVTGIALLLMRFSCAAITWPTLARLWPAAAAGWLVVAAAAVLILALVTGLGTRAAALLLSVALIAALFAAQRELAPFLFASTGGAIALALLGSGAWSIDAHRFGRRVIRLEPRSPDRGGAG
jgi:uncharacterized membrane protein YphA (DoxX/SURF4 family)